tara:strand:+ start:108 stop:245 length:138 start_codon:yes stop_codon:yes gene_type:complete
MGEGSVSSRGGEGRRKKRRKGVATVVLFYNVVAIGTCNLYLYIYL